MDDQFSLSVFVDGRPYPLTADHSIRFVVRGGALTPVLLLNDTPVNGKIDLVVRMGCI